MESVKPMVVATSKWIEKDARKSLIGSRTDIVMIYDWIDRKTFYPRNAINIRKKYNLEDRLVILGVATGWSSDKGQDEMIKVATQMPEAKVILVGHQSEKKEYPSNIITIDFTDSKEELAEIYSAADVFFNPSKQETFGLVSGEALACGTPIIVYNTTACPEFVTEYTGVILEENDDIVKAVQRILETKEKYGSKFIEDQCVNFVSDNFDMNKNIEEYIRLFKEVINCKHCVQ